MGNLQSWLEARLQQSRSTLHTLEPVLAVRHSALQLIASGLRDRVISVGVGLDSPSKSVQELLTHQARLLDSALADSWLQRAKLARKWVVLL